MTGLQDRQNRDVKKIVAACGLKLEIRFAHKWINRRSQKISVTTQLSRDNYELTGSFFSLSFWLVQNPSFLKSQKNAKNSDSQIPSNY